MRTCSNCRTLARTGAGSAAIPSRSCASSILPPRGRRAVPEQRQRSNVLDSPPSRARVKGRLPLGKRCFQHRASSKPRCASSRRRCASAACRSWICAATGGTKPTESSLRVRLRCAGRNVAGASSAPGPCQCGSSPRPGAPALPVQLPAGPMSGWSCRSRWHRSRSSPGPGACPDWRRARMLAQRTCGLRGPPSALRASRPPYP